VLKDIAPISYKHINLRGILTFDLTRLGPSLLDLWTLDKVASFLTEAEGYRERQLRSFALLNFADPQGADNADAAAALRDAPALTYLETPVGRRKAFPNAAAAGLSMLELKPQDPKASGEIVPLRERKDEGIDRLSQAVPTECSSPFTCYVSIFTRCWIDCLSAGC
jgi:hypothetical protein